MALPPDNARCGTCFWARTFDTPRLQHVAGVESPTTLPALFCCHERPRMETLAESICPDWEARDAETVKVVP